VSFEVAAEPTAIAYASLADAESADEARGGGAAFLALDDEVQAQMLTAASIDLDTAPWIGGRATTTQEREWPRTGTAYSDDAWPQILVDATIELAFANARKLAADASTDLLNPVPSNLKRKKTGPIEKEYFAPTAAAATEPTRWPTIVQALIAPLIRVAAVSGWGSAVAIRTS
jgi:hypothetical protein